MNILLTGSTGFIGKRLVRSLAANGHSIGLLIRSGSLSRAKKMFQHLPQVQFIEADISRNDVVVRVAGAEAVLQNTDAVIHLAGTYDLSVPLEEAYTHNVIGTQNMVWFAQRLTKLPYFHYISTYAVNSHCQGHVGEDQLDSTSKLADHYAQTKLQAESIVRQATWGNTHVRVYRPGVIVGDSNTGEMDKIDGPYFFFRLFNQMRQWKSVTRKMPFFPIVGRQGAQVPLLPVNILADWLTALVENPTTHSMRSYHLVSQELLLVENFLRESLKAYDVPLMVRRMPETRILNPILPFLGIPREVAPYLYSTASFSREHLDEDFPQLKAPLLNDYLSKLVEGARELFK
jgi:thioester reductase-like protein